MTQYRYVVTHYDEPMTCPIASYPTYDEARLFVNTHDQPSYYTIHEVLVLGSIEPIEQETTE